MSVNPHDVFARRCTIRALFLAYALSLGPLAFARHVARRDPVLAALAVLSGLALGLLIHDLFSGRPLP